MTWVANIAQIKNIWTPPFNLFLYWRPFYQSLANFDSTINDWPYLFNPFQGFSSHVSRHSSRGSQGHLWKRKCILPEATYSHVRVSAATVRCQHAACPQSLRVIPVLPQATPAAAHQDEASRVSLWEGIPSCFISSSTGCSFLRTQRFPASRI